MLEPVIFFGSRFGMQTTNKGSTLPDGYGKGKSIKHYGTTALRWLTQLNAIWRVIVIERCDASSSGSCTFSNVDNFKK